jgi:flagellar hook-associated protein 2
MLAPTSSSSNSATSSLLSALGGGTGINPSALAEQLAAAEFGSRLGRITNQSERLTTQISAASTLRSMVTTLAASMGQRVRVGDLAVTPLIGNAAVATVSKGVASGKGTATLEVTSLAKGQTVTSPIFSAGTAPTGSGTLTLRFGNIASGAFTADSARAAVNITIAQGAKLTDVVSAINNSDAGVSAYIATDANGARIVLKGTDGAANAFVLEATDDPADPGLSALAWNPSSLPARLAASASDALFTLDGVSQRSASNTITDAAPGLSLKLTGTNAGAPTTITFSDPGAAISGAMQDLTSALNEMMAELNRNTDPVGGTLNADPGTRALRRSMAALAGSIVMPNAAAGAPSTLSDLGLATNRDGTFKFDAARLTATLQRDPAGTAAMFTNGLFGVYSTLDKLSRTTTATGDGASIGGSIARMTALQGTLGAKRTTLETKQEDLRVKLLSRYAALNRQVSGSQSTLSFLQARFSNQNGNNN